MSKRVHSEAKRFTALPSLCEFAFLTGCNTTVSGRETFHPKAHKDLAGMQTAYGPRKFGTLGGLRRLPEAPGCNPNQRFTILVNRREGLA